MPQVETALGPIDVDDLEIIGDDGFTGIIVSNTDELAPGETVPVGIRLVAGEDAQVARTAYAIMDSGRDDPGGIAILKISSGPACPEVRAEAVGTLPEDEPNRGAVVAGLPRGHVQNSVATRREGAVVVAVDRLAHVVAVLAGIDNSVTALTVTVAVTVTVTVTVTITVTIAITVTRLGGLRAGFAAVRGALARFVGPAHRFARSDVDALGAARVVFARVTAGGDAREDQQGRADADTAQLTEAATVSHGLTDYRSVLTKRTEPRWRRTPLSCVTTEGHVGEAPSSSRVVTSRECRLTRVHAN